MAFENGTAVNMFELINKLETFAAASGWTVELSTVPTPDYLVLSKTEVGTGAYSIAVGFAVYNTVPLGGQNLRCWTAPVYVGGDFDNQPYTSPKHHICGWDNTTGTLQDIQYYFVVSDTAIIIAISINNTWRCQYFGLLNALTSLGHWSSPLVASGDTKVANTLYSEQSDNVSSINAYKSANSATSLRMVDQEWKDIDYVWPGNSTRAEHTWLRKSPESGDIMLAPMIVVNKAKGHTMGEFNGVFACTGDNLVAGVVFDDPVTQSTYLIVNNIYRTNRNDYFAVELI